MTNRYAWPWMAVVVLVLAWIEPAPCSAQTPPAPNSPTPAPRPNAPPTPNSPTPAPRPNAPATPAPGRQPTTPPTSGTPRVRSVMATQPGLPAEATLASAVDNMKLKTAPLEPSDLRFPINLATALRLSDARPLIVAAAQASVWVAEAQLTRAKVIWVPVLTFGADYIRHDGGGPDFNKGYITTPSVNYFYGGLAANLYVNLTDSFFEPLVARQVLNARQWDIQSAKNDALLQTATAYFNVHQNRGIYAGALYTVERGHDLVERINQLSNELVPKVEVDRARNMVADLEQQATAAREVWRIQSANLTQILRLDPRAVVVPLEHDHLQVTLIDPKRQLDELMPVALANRPELASNRALIHAAEQRIRREQYRPLLPAIQINGFQSAGMLLQAGIFGLGPNGNLDQYTGRVDISYQLVWQLDAFGIGNLARVKQQRGQESNAIVELRHTQDMVAADVNKAQAHLQSAAARVSQADRALRTAVITFNGNLEGLRHTTRFENVLVLVYRPQEAVYALELMKLAFDEYFTTVADYNRAQFEMFHALGYPARELADLRPAGEVMPVDTARPGYLPQVGQGPPRATR